jgi:hypothetical protein
MGDTQVFHYGVFLMKAGMSPYRQIIDFNMPGSYWFDFFATTLFGSSDLGWRLYDYTLLTLLAFATISITATYDWFAGLYAAVLFALIHGSEGPLAAAERDEVMTVLVVVGYALVFLGVRYRRPVLFFTSGICLALAATIKPTAATFEVLLTVIALFQLRKEGVRTFPFLRAIVLGTLIVLAATLMFFLWRSSFSAFFGRALPLAAFYSASIRPSFPYLLHYSTPRGLIPLLPLAGLLFFLNKSWRDWRFQAIIGGVIFGLASYFIQTKGFTYHRYPFVTFALLWCGMEFTVALRRGRLIAMIGGAGLLIGAVLVAPFYLYRSFNFVQTDQISMGLVNDLGRYPSDKLDGRVQCLDGVAGCYSALYRLRLTQSTGLMGDQLLFSSRPNPAVDRYRDEFITEIKSNPPLIFVETSYTFGDPQSFDKIDRWPAFADFLRTNYVLVGGGPGDLRTQEADVMGYRIYLRAGSQLGATTQ